MTREVRFTLAESGELKTQRGRAAFAAPLLTYLAEIENTKISKGSRFSARGLSAVLPVLFAILELEPSDSDSPVLAAMKDRAPEMLRLHVLFESGRSTSRAPFVRFARELLTVWIADARPTKVKRPRGANP